MCWNYRWAHFGRRIEDKGEYEKALVDLTRGIDLDPESTLGLNNRGIIYQRQGKYMQALADFSQAIELGKQAKELSPKPYNNRGNVYSKGWINSTERFSGGIIDNILWS